MKNLLKHLNIKRRTSLEKMHLEKKLKLVYKDLKVRRGPFLGLVYPNFTSVGSSLFPKIIGVYEHEISEIINNQLQKSFEYIIDVGCAEGYYAVGMAKYGESEKVVAYDIDKKAQYLCSLMAKENNVNIEIRKELTVQDLENFPFNCEKMSFIVADCEGYELELFTQSSIQNLKNVECLIEVHDWCQNEHRIKDILINLFEKTHDCISIQGKDDYDKAYEYRIEELSEFSIRERLYVFAEGRKRLGVWLYCKPKQD